MTRKETAAGPVHALPADLKKALATDRALAKTRERRIAVGLDKLRKGMRQPCCWPGCPHR